MNAHTSLNEILILCKLKLNKPPFRLKGATPLEVASERVYSLFRRGPFDTVDDLIKYAHSVSIIRHADIYCPDGFNRITGYEGFAPFTCSNGVIVDVYAPPQVNFYNDFVDEEGEDIEEEDPDF